MDESYFGARRIRGKEAEEQKVKTIVFGLKRERERSTLKL